MKMKKADSSEEQLMRVGIPSLISCFPVYEALGTLQTGLHTRLLCYFTMKNKEEVAAIIDNDDITNLFLPLHKIYGQLNIEIDQYYWVYLVSLLLCSLLVYSCSDPLLYHRKFILLYKLTVAYQNERPIERCFSYLTMLQTNEVV